jgi:hypothetical protein
MNSPVSIPLGDVVVPGVYGVLVEDGVVDLQPELAAEHGAAAAGVHDHPAREVHLLLPDPRPHAARVAVVVEQHLADLHALVDLGAEPLGMFQHQQVQLAAVDVVGVVLVHALLRELLEPDGVLLAVERVPRRPVLVDEPLALQYREEVQFLEDPGRRGDHRLPDVGPGMNGTFEDQVLDPAFDRKHPIAEPAGPPPMMITSCIVVPASVRRIDPFVAVAPRNLQPQEPRDDVSLNVRRSGV